MEVSRAWLHALGRKVPLDFIKVGDLLRCLFLFRLVLFVKVLRERALVVFYSVKR